MYPGRPLTTTYQSGTEKGAVTLAHPEGLLNRVTYCTGILKRQASMRNTSRYGRGELSFLTIT